MRILCTILPFLLCILLTPLAAQTPLIPPPPTPELEIPREMPPAVPAAPHPLAAEDVEAFLDGYIPLQLQDYDIAGATIAIVKDGKLLFAKGYGYADYEKKKPVSAEMTLFRPGSVSKLFTWTAVMQLVEQGKIDLDKDVNTYLDFKIPEAFSKPITVRHLLTHTPGFEDPLKDLFVGPARSRSLGGYLKKRIPRRIYPPGTTLAYSNYGASLAGYIVERVSGRPFAAYTEENIFKPLRMNRSTFVQPLPGPLSGLMSNGYNKASDGAKPFEVVAPEPAGSMSATATDMANFMIAHLNGGQLNGARILRPETTARMHSLLHAWRPGVNGVAHGFYEESRNGHRIIGHGGDTQYFHTYLHLVPDANLGFYVSYNSAGDAKVEPRSLLWDAFLDRYLPERAAPAVRPTAKEDAKAVSGTYLSSRRAEGSFLKAFSVLGELTVSPAQDGMITVAQIKGPNGKPRRWREVGEWIFRDTEGKDELAFKRGEGGRMELLLTPYPIFVFQKVSLWNNQRVLMPVLVVSLILMALTLLAWPIAALVRRHYRRPLELPPLERRLRLGVRVVLVLNLVFVIFLAVLLARAEKDITMFNDGLDKWLILAQFIGLLGAIGTMVVLYDAIHSWSSAHRRIWGRLYASALALGCLGFVWFLLAGNLLRFTTQY